MFNSLLLMKFELCLTIIIFLLLFIKISFSVKNENLIGVVQILLLLNLLISFFFNKSGALFGDMFQSSNLIIFQKQILNIGLYLISLLFTDWLKKSNNIVEFFILTISAVLGMFFLLSSRNWLMFYLALELATIPVAALCNFNLFKKESSEAGMKLIFSSAFSSGLFLFGISLWYGITGSLNFTDVANVVSTNPLHILAFIFVFTALAFKLSVVPFHFWTADVYEGAPIPVGAFLSVMSKGVTAFVFIQIMYAVFGSLTSTWIWMVTILSVATMLIGNLFALRQTNMKRFLAYSSIAQVGFILFGATAISKTGESAIIYFVLIYIFSNLAAFSICSIIKEHTEKLNISDYKGLYATNPWLSWIMALAMFSLAGIPPTAGFFGKLFLISAGASHTSFGILIIVALNLIVSLFYYLKIVKAIFMDKPEADFPSIKVNLTNKFGLLLCSAGIVLGGVLYWIYDYIATLY